MSLGGTGEPLTIIRALYGDPSVLTNGPVPSLRVVTYEPRRLRRIELQKDVVAFAAGWAGHCSCFPRVSIGSALVFSGAILTP